MTLVVSSPGGVPLVTVPARRSLPTTLRSFVPLLNLGTANDTLDGTIIVYAVAESGSPVG
jgi:hypothetical protein